MQAPRDTNTAKVDDGSLIERSKKGDLSAFDELLRRHEKQVYSFAYRMTQNYDDASDIASDSFIKAYQAINRFRGESNFTTWLFRIVTNTFLDRRKRSKSHLNIPLDDYIELEENSVARQFEDPAPDPLDLLEASERNDTLQTAINSLPEYQRMMILLFHTQGLSYEDISLIVDLPIGTVKSRLNRARLALREKLEPARELFDV
ncbi:MAG: sigma-70 family RNA polymerase sigma factor [Armatimonadota bacterium]